MPKMALLYQHNPLYRYIGMMIFAKELETPRPSIQKMTSHPQPRQKTFQYQGLAGPTSERMFHLALGYFRRNAVIPRALSRFLDDKEKEKDVFMAAAFEIEKRKKNPNDDF